jgi:CheY-like chemotaxis protein
MPEIAARFEHTGIDGPILVVDDCDPVRRAVVQLLSAEGYDVVAAVDGTKALERLVAGLVPSMIILDLCMPRTDGFGFRRAQLADATLRRVATLAYSNDVTRSLLAGRLGMPFFHKVHDLGRLLVVVAQHCTRHPPAHAGA